MNRFNENDDEPVEGQLINMMCYKDMTFCDAPCTNTLCHRLLTLEVKEAASQWWCKGKPGHKAAPIAVADLSDGCEGYKSI